MGFIKGILRFIEIIFSFFIVGKIFSYFGQIYPEIGTPSMWWLWAILVPTGFTVMFAVTTTGFVKILKNVICINIILTGLATLLVNSTHLLKPDVWFIVMLGILAIPVIAIVILKAIGNYMLYYNAGYDFIRHINNKN
jgi:hypothetical protein